MKVKDVIKELEKDKNLKCCMSSKFEAHEDVTKGGNFHRYVGKHISITIITKKSWKEQIDKEIAEAERLFPRRY